MGCDAKAILYYGIQLGEEDPMSGEEEKKDYDAANGAWAKLNRPKEPESTGYLGPQWDKWRELLKEYESSAAHVEIDWSGSDYGQRYYVHCPCLEKSVEWDEQLDLGRDVLFGTNPEANVSIKSFCDKFGIEYTKPSWHLASMYF